VLEGYKGQSGMLGWGKVHRLGLVLLRQVLRLRPALHHRQASRLRVVLEEGSRPHLQGFRGGKLKYFQREKCLWAVYMTYSQATEMGNELMIISSRMVGSW